MTTVLETIYQPRESIIYTDPTMDADADYPVDVGPTVLPEIWAPRLYGKGLSMLEVGSSGKVAFTASDKQALAVDVRVLQSPNVAGSNYDSTSLTLPTAGMSLGTAAYSVLNVTPGVAPDTANLDLVGERVGVAATSELVLTASSMATNVTGAVVTTAGEISQVSTAGTIALSAFTDVVLSAGGNPTVTIKNDRIIVKGNIDIDGVVNSTAIQSLQTLQVTDNYIEVADGLEHEVTGGAAGSQNGLRINTVPNGGTMVSDDAVDTYLKKFKSSDGGLAFYTAGVFDQAKYAAANVILNKGLLFNVNGGSASGGDKTQQSRDSEPYWDVLGGAMKITRVVPSATNDLVHRMSMALRVTNTGELEIVRHKVPLTLTNGSYLEGTPEPSKVVARFGHAIAV
jgi:hypothetical protein